MEGKLIIFSAPSGSGKTTLVRELLKHYPQFEFSISATSRAPRGVEQNGVEYRLKLKNSQCETLILLKRTAFESYNGAWSVTFINGIAVDNYLNLKLVFDIENNSVHGNIGCNTMNGVINTHPDNPDKISFSNMITTRMSCPNMEIEIALLKALESVVEINLGENNSEAYLLDAKGSKVVNLQRLVIK